MLFRERQLMKVFKPGDWVKYKDQQDTTIYKVMDILSNDLIDIEDTIVDKYDIELWQPKPNEWCWFWNVTDFDAPTLSRFCGMQDKLFRCTNSKQNLFTHCEPFIGQLPTSLKDNS